MVLDDTIFSGDVSIAATMSETSTVKIKSSGDHHQVSTYT